MAPMIGHSSARESSLVHLAYERLVYYPRSAAERSYERDLEGRGPGWLRYTNVQDLLASFFLGCHFNGGKRLNWREMCIGIGSEAVVDADERHQHMPFLDYDGKHIKTTVRQDVKLLQEKYGLGPASVYHTKRGAHVYFLHDLVPKAHWSAILEDSHCCPGFRTASQRRGFSVLRISAKYTEFDIALDQIIPANDGVLRRKNRKGHLIEALLGLGTACGTHFASLFPQWATYSEDPRPWKPSARRAPHTKGKFIIKQAAPAAPAPPGADPEELLKMLELLKKGEEAGQPVGRPGHYYGDVATSAPQTVTVTHGNGVTSQYFVVDSVAGSNVSVNLDVRPIFELPEEQRSKYADWANSDIVSWTIQKKKIE